jgi:cysteine desulfuration protein SufE
MASELDELAGDFGFLDDWEDRYRHILDLGRDLVPLTPAEHNEANKVRGCARQVWLVRDPAPDGRLVFRGDSDAHLVRGLIAILLRLYSGRTAAEILAFDAPAAVERLGLAGALSSQRANGLASMVERIRREAASPAGLQEEAVER